MKHSISEAKIEVKTKKVDRTDEKLKKTTHDNQHESKKNTEVLKKEKTFEEMDVSNLNLSTKRYHCIYKYRNKIDVLKEVEKRNHEKPSLNAIVIGHVDAGKSTL